MIGRILHKLSTRKCDSGSRCGNDSYHDADLTWIGRWRYTNWRPFTRKKKEV